MPEITETEKAKSGDAKVHQTMHEFKHGTLHSGSKKGPKVTNRRQAIAIALSQAGRAKKAANYGAHVGQAIAGNLFRGAGGQFTGGAGGAAAPAKPAPAPKPDKAATAAQQREARQKLADQQRQERQAARDQTKTDAQQKAVQNVGDLADKLLDGDLAEVLTVGDPIGNIDGVESAYGDKLVARGLANKYPDGTYDLSPTGRTMVNAMKKGNERQAKVAIMRAQALADRKAQAAARRGKRGKKEQFVLAIKAAGSFRAYKNYSQGAVKTEIAQKELTAKPFTAYKDINGRWRWLVRSSSAFEDRDGETVSQKALEGAVAKLNARGNFGILDWWHTPVKLGTCDFSAMHGKVLVESGTFASELIGERIGTAIKSGQFDPGTSLMFAHNEPGPQVVPGRVFQDIEIIRRSLLPEEKASNAVTTMEIFNLAEQNGLATKEVVLKMDALKEQKLKELLGPELVEQFLSGSALAEKSLELAGLSYKAMSPPMAPPPVVTDPTKKKLDTKADGIMAAAAGPDAPVEGSPEEEAAETPEEEAAEPPDPGEDMAGGDADQIIQGLYDEVDAIIGRRMQSTADEIVAKLSSIKGVSSKETDEALSVMTIALKENTSALNTVITENASLKARLDALEGKQPPVVAQRASASKANQVTNPELIEALKAQNQTQVDPNDPFAFAYKNWQEQGAPLPLTR